LLIGAGQAGVDSQSSIDGPTTEGGIMQEATATATIDTPPKFRLGQCVATPPALAILEEAEVLAADLLKRHVSGDWGESLGSEDAASNDQALVDGDRILSAYVVNGNRLWVITEHDRSATTILRPEDY
jgi:hypothetical protein